MSTIDGLFGFKLQEKRFIKEVHAECLFFEHEKSGASLLKIASDDANKTFCIAFKTLPESDNGVPHILEHSVLNGSTGFPVKSPFDVLLKGSLHTFLNAMTGKDITLYPVASMNEKDYFNLMHVYLDAVFNPLIYQDERILEQEGWHYELEEENAPLTYKGVVYNEMKGSFSNPVRELWYQVFKHLFPDTVYGVESGGYPSEIPSLTYEQFIDFHRKYYHPENSYIYLYGNGPLEKELEFIDRNYLSNYSRTGSTVVIPNQASFAAMKDLHGFYPVSEGDATDEQTFLTLNWVVGEGADKALTLSLDLLCEVLVNQESAPLRLALQKAGIGQDVNASASIFQQNVVQIMVRNADPHDKDAFRDIVFTTLQEVVTNGLDKKEVEGVLNRMEFLIREGSDAQKGMLYIDQSYPGFFYKNDPFIGLQYELPLEEVKSALTSDYLEKIILTAFLHNNHCLLFTLEPKPGLDQEVIRTTEEELNRYAAALDSSEKAVLVRKTKELIEYQQRQESTEALASIPMLGIEDIDVDACFYACEEERLYGVPVLLHEEFTNDVVYFQLYFNLKVLPKELIPTASLLANLMGLLDTEKYSYGELNQLLNIHTGGFYTSLTSFLQDYEDDKLSPHFVVTTKAMNHKTTNLFELVDEILWKTTFSDTERIKTLLTRHLSQLDASIKRAGNRYSSIRLASYYSQQGAFREWTEGLEYYWFVQGVAKGFEVDPSGLTSSLAETVRLLFGKNNVVAALTCFKDDRANILQQIAEFLRTIPEGAGKIDNWSLDYQNKKEGIATASQVQYVMQGYSFKKLGYQWNGQMRVLNQVLSTDWLQTQIRVIGGAYGGYSTITPAGFLTFNSYRDPNLQETLQNFAATPGYLEKFAAEKSTMTRYIIGTISSMDQPLTPFQKGEHAFSHYFTGRTKEAMQTDRNAVLSTTDEDIRNFTEMIRKVLEQNHYCVYGNEEKIRQEEYLFDEIVKIEK